MFVINPSRHYNGVLEFEQKKKTANLIKTELQNLLNEVEMLWTSVLTRGKLPVANHINDLIVYV